MITIKDLKERPLSASSLKAFRQSPAHFTAYREGVKKKTAAMILGSICHSRILQPDLFQKQYESSVLNRGTKGFDAEVALLEKEFTLITEAEAEQSLIISEAVHAHPRAAQLIKGCKQIEKTINWEQDGLPMTMIADGIGADYFLELKTAESAEMEAFGRQAYNLGYHVQAGTYTLGVTNYSGERKPCTYIVVEKSPPYAVNVLLPDDDYIGKGVATFKRSLADFTLCMEKKRFNEAYEFYQMFDTLSLPAYAK